MLIRCLALEEPGIVAVAIRPGVVDTAMQTVVRTKGKKYDQFWKIEGHCILHILQVLCTHTTLLAPLESHSGSNVMAEQDHSRFVGLHASNQLLSPEDPAHVIAALVVGGAKKEYSGGYYNWDGEEFAEFMRKK